jgi:hypothetical protein
MSEVEDTAEFSCAITGRPAPDDEVVDDAQDDDDLENMPVGWLRITVERRGVNPEWVKIQAAKHAALEGVMSQVPADAPEEFRKQTREMQDVVINASFYAYEASIAKYLTFDEEVYVRNPDQDKEAAEGWKGIAEILGLSVGLVEERK